MRRNPLVLSFLPVLAVAVSFAPAVHAAPDAIRIEGPEQQKVDFRIPNGGLKKAAGVRNVEVYHASKDSPADGKGYTYHHHPDLAAWKGRLYLAWNSCEKDEDTWPSRDLYCTSTDGIAWSKPAELFPQGASVQLRTYFFHAPNGRMIAIAGMRTDQAKVTERKKGPMIGREMTADHSLGPVFTLRPAENGGKSLAGQFPSYKASADAGLIDACEKLLSNRPFLEQQDHGNLLGDRKMKWHDPAIWSHADKELKWYMPSFGKAMSIFHRKDGALVAIGKAGFVTLSTDEGATWSPPARPGSLVTGGGKVWGQRTSDGRYALAYNPHRDERFPLVVVSGDDGITFKNMAVVYGEKTPMRHPGESKSPGPQYVRGISEWASDGSWKDTGMWITYSVNKEDIWISRIPVPIRSE